MNSSIEAHRLLLEMRKAPVSTSVFPSHFSVTIQLRTAISDQKSNNKTVANIIRKEPLIASKIVTAANSANMAGLASIVDIEKSIQRLGLDQIKRIVLGVTMLQLVHAKEILPYSDLFRLVWLNSIYTASSASVIARQYTDESPSEAFFAGLVLNIGAFYLLYRAAVNPVLQKNMDDVVVFVKDDYIKRSIEVLECLNMPKTIIESIHIQEKSFENLAMDELTMSDCIYLGSLLAAQEYPWLTHDEETQPDLTMFKEHASDIADLFLKTKSDAS